MFNTKVLNDIKIRPVKLETTKTNVYGSDMLKNPYGTIALVSKTNTGKTTTLYNMLNHTIDPKRKTNVVIFCSTHEMDPTYDKIKELLERKKCIVFSHYHFMEYNENIIDHYLDIIQNPPEENDIEEIKERRPQADGSGDRLIVKTIKKNYKRTCLFKC